MQEVVGSSPISSTLKARRPEGRRAFFIHFSFGKFSLHTLLGEAAQLSSKDR